MSRRFSDFENEEFVDQLIKGLVDVYGSAKEEIMTLLAKSSLTSFEQDRLSKLMRQVRGVVDKLDASAGNFAANSIPRAYKAGQNIAGEALQEQGITAMGDLGAQIHTEAVNVIVQQMAIDALEKNGSIYSNVNRALQRTQQDLLSEAQINKQIAQGVIQGETRVQTSKRISEQLIQELGEGKLITAGGRQFTPESYAELLARTRTREAVTNGIINSAAQVGMDLFQVSVHDNPCAVCLPYQGRIFSRSGTHPDFPKLEVQPPFHPRCKHVLVPVLESVLKKRGQYDKLVALSKDPKHVIDGTPDYQAALRGEGPEVRIGKGRPVSTALKLDPKSALGQIGKRTIEAIDGVHSDGNLPVINLYADSVLQKSNGRFIYTEEGKVVGIRVRPGSETPHLTLAHEIGHFLDFSGIDGTPQTMWSTEVNPAFRPLMKALYDSKASKAIEKLRLNNDSRVVKHANYLAEPPEMFARAYAQYIAQKSNDQVLLKQLAFRRRRGEPGQVWYPYQWSKNDFAPIMKEIDDLFRGMGWIE